MVFELVGVVPVSALLLVVVVFYVLYALLILLLVHVHLDLFLLHLLFLLVRRGLILRQVVEVEGRHYDWFLAEGAHVGSTVDGFEGVVAVEGEHEAALVVRHVVLVLRHYVCEPRRWDVLDAFLLVEFVDGHAFVLEGEEEEEELVLFVFVVLDLLLHLRQPPLQRLHLHQQIRLPVSDHVLCHEGQLLTVSLRARIALPL